MNPVARRPSSRAALLCLAALATALLAGCVSHPAKKPSEAKAPTYVAPANLVLGRVVSFDPKAGIALVELSPLSSIPADLASRSLIARDPDTLKTTAQLVASGRRAATILGVYVVDGHPSPDDEVVLPPFAP